MTDQKEIPNMITSRHEIAITRDTVEQMVKTHYGYLTGFLPGMPDWTDLDVQTQAVFATAMSLALCGATGLTSNQIQALLLKSNEQGGGEIQ